MALSLSFIVLKAQDLDKSLAFYRALGLQFSEVHDDGPPCYSCDLGNVVLELYFGMDAKKESIQEVDVLGFDVKDCDGIASKLQDLGYSRIDSKPYVIFHDPDGRRVLLKEHQG